MLNLEDSNLVLQLDENNNEIVIDKNNDNMAAVVDGKSVSWDFVLDKISEPYIKKNDQAAQPQKRDVVAPSQSGISDEEGKYIPGHPNYGK